MSKLVIVESPAKAKTIKKYLGGDYEVIASMGHVRDLPKARLCVDVKNDFKPKYAIIKGKEKLVSELKEAAEEADTVYLATDPALWAIRSARSSQKRFAAVFPQAVCSPLHCASSWIARKRSASLSPKNTGLSTHA